MGQSIKACSEMKNWTVGLSCEKGVALITSGESDIGKATKTVELYSPLEEGRQLEENLPEGRWGHSIDFLEGRLYICGGKNEEAIQKSCLVGKPTLDSGT